MKKGRGWHGDSTGHAAAGRLGGEATARSQDETFYSEIGRKGGRSRARRRKEQPVLSEDEIMDYSG